MAASAYPTIPNMQKDILVFNTVKVKNFKINRTLCFVLDRGNINLTARKIPITGINMPHSIRQLKRKLTILPCMKLHFINSLKTVFCLPAGLINSSIINVICPLHTLNIILRVKAGFLCICLGWYPDLCKPFTVHKF